LKQLSQCGNGASLPTATQSFTDLDPPFRAATLEFGDKPALIFKGVQIDRRPAASTHDVSRFRFVPTCRAENLHIKLLDGSQRSANKLARPELSTLFRGELRGSWQIRICGRLLRGQGELRRQLPMQASRSH